MKKIAVVITTFNSAKCIGRLIDKLLSQSYPVRRIIIVDNNSSDNTCSIINGYHNDKIHLHQLGSNLGGAGGFAKGFEIAKNDDCDYIVSFDDDAYPKDKNFVEHMLWFKNKYQLDVVAPLVVDTNNHTKTAYEYKVGEKKITDVGELCILECISGIKLFNGVLFDRAVITKLKGPRPEFFIRGDEEEFRQRILQAGFRVVTFPAQIVYHPTSVTEYYYIDGQRYHHIDSHFKLFYSTRNRFYILRLRQDISVCRKAKIIFKEFKCYSWFYLIYKRSWQDYVLWLKAFVFGLFGYMKRIEFK